MSREGEQRRIAGGSATGDATEAGAGGVLGALAADGARPPAGGELTVQFQPIVRPADGEVVGLEALARWRRPDGRLLEARDFVEEVERAGLISRLDRRTTRTVERVAGRSRLPPGLEWISVDVSPRSLGSGRLEGRLEALAEELGRHGLDLVVELSRGVGDLGREEASAKLSSLRAAGIRVALDHYGTKPFLLDRVLDLPVDLVKIDVRPAPARPGGPADPRGYLRSLVRLFRSLGRAVVLVEVGAPLSRTESLVAEADLVQGESFGRPAFLACQR